ncbi:non-reducing end alpha-L-arabinofuranosidase family hydrolase [Streptomyces lateritius]|uniref:non-reducing end alpha-L-arabinofuranosidase n=1 Tax=Streptomyces lateritius TaxID=67313 RepID=A0ABW6YJD0_9ACTN
MPIDRVGLQAHFGAGARRFPDDVVELRPLDGDVQITELDVAQAPTTAFGQCPHGFTNTVIAAHGSTFAFSEASSVLLPLLATGNVAGSWTPMAASESDPFARANNATFPSRRLTVDNSHGEMIPAGHDRTPTVPATGNLPPALRPLARAGSGMASPSGFDCRTTR